MIEPNDYSFRRGLVLRCRWTANGKEFRPETWRDRWTSVLVEAFWPSRKCVVTAIDRERGTITIGDA